MKPFARRSILLVAITAAYYVVARLGLLLAFPGTNVSPVWPPTGIAFAAVFLFGYELLPGIALGAFLANFTTGIAFLPACAVAIGNAGEAFVGVYLLSKFGVKKNFLDRPGDVFLFLFFPCLIATALSATIGSATIYWAGYSHGFSVFTLWYTWWLGDTGGNLILAPLIVSWVNPYRIEWTITRKIETGLIFGAILFIGKLVFTGSFSFGVSLAYLTLPFVVLSAFRTAQRGATTAVFLLSAIAVWGTGGGTGPFQGGNVYESLLFLQMFMAVVAATSLVLCAVITDAKKAQEKLEASLREKEVLLREIHHRVKNNLQVISSLLSLQSQKLDDPAVLKVFQESAARIRAMAMIHEKLYGATNFSNIQFSDYVKTLADDLVKSYSLRPEDIRLEISSNDVVLDITKAVPLGLIVNELVSNACKYAFPAGKSGRILVELQTDEAMEVRISDDGIGLPANFDAHSARTLGYRLVKLLVQQLQGRFEVTSANPGTSIRMTFPLGPL